MSYAGFRFTGRNATLARPEDRLPVTEGDTWARDASGGGGGTEADATWFNRIKANLENLITRLSGNPNDGDNQLANAIGNAIAAKADADHDHDDLYLRDAEVAGLIAAAVALLQPLSAKGQANGYAGLDGSGKVPTAQLPSAVLGQLDYRGVWNASTNSPALASGVGTKGDYYVVTTAGATALNGITDWQVGDWAVYNGTAWDKVDNTDAVVSVAGLTGAITAAALKTALAITMASITDASPNGRSLITAANYAAMRGLLGLGSAALLTAGAAANNVVQLDGSGKLPAVDGSQLTGMPGVTLASQAEAQAGTDNTKAMTPLRVAQAITALAFPAGSVMQTASTAKTDTFTTTSTTDVDLTGLSVAITPTSTSDKILVRAVIKWQTSGSSAKPVWTLLRGATKIAIGDAAGSRTRASGSSVGISIVTDGCYTEVIEFLDSPASASAQTYKIQVRTSASSLYINRNLTDADSAANDRLISTITAQVIKG